ncbi:MAG TPA: family 1 glycosylhydrolase [Bryobacteraceae bacterium]|jgi:beta-glucosidase/6-phospho-beta-glucosidase/beta-galactosidase|nr:family 1 glycosylhydrolase [Bryobacteraceae bacterium]
MKRSIPRNGATLIAHHKPHTFMFATGIENSYPVVTGKDGRDHRVDEMAKCGHYTRWKEDFQLVKEIGLDFLRYGPPLYRDYLAPGRYDWDFADQTFAELRRLRIHPIVDLCHFGVPPWAGNFQNPDWPRLFADYAKAFARRFPWVRLYTPVNEIFVTALFSGQYGWWNERLKSDVGFVTALKHLAKANLLAEEAILKVQPQALFIQSESTEYFHAIEPEALPRAAVLNHKRFLSLDLSYGHDVRGVMYEYLMDHGMTREEYHWFLSHAAHMRPYCVMGNDYYVTNEHAVPSHGPIQGSGEIFGYYVITRQYYERYHLPVMHTETNLGDAVRAPAWLWKEWANMVRLKEDGVPIIGFTWYSLTDQVDWDTTLREDNGHVNPLGLYDLDRKIRPVGEAYRKLVNQWRNILPTESLCLHQIEPEEFDAPDEETVNWERGE